MTEVFSISILVVVTELYEFLQTPRTVHFERVILLYVNYTSINLFLKSILINCYCTRDKSVIQIIEITYKANEIQHVLCT